MEASMARSPRVVARCGWAIGARINQTHARLNERIFSLGDFAFPESTVVGAERKAPLQHTAIIL
jgi:hypothetical protein